MEEKTMTRDEIQKIVSRLDQDIQQLEKSLETLERSQLPRHEAYNALRDQKLDFNVRLAELRHDIPTLTKRADPWKKN